MPYRYAVLWEPAEDGARPVGLAVEQDGFVLVEVRSDLGFADRYDGAFEVCAPDMSIVRYEPGDAGYFDQVMLDMSRSFIIGEQGQVENASQGVVLRLLSIQVFAPLRQRHQELYWTSAPTFPSVVSYRQQNYSHEPTPAVHGAEPVKVAQGQALVAA